MSLPTTLFSKSSLTLAIIAALIFSLLPQYARAACVHQGNYYSDEDCVRLGIRDGLYSGTQVQIQTQTQARVQLTMDEALRLEAQVRQLLALIEQLKLRLSQSSYSNYYYYPTTPNNTGSLVRVYTGTVNEVEDDRATLEGRVDFGTSDDATVYFRYGYYSNTLDRETTHLVLDDNDDEDFSTRIIYLKRDTEYFYQAIAEDEDGRRAYGTIRSFSTDDRSSSSNDDEPEADTDRAQDITDDSAELHGSVDMNDFNNGRVFFVWGEDEDQIQDVEDDYDSYSDVDEGGDDLQKQQVDSDLDDSDDYTLDINGLDNDADIYFTICVEYKDDDGDDTLVCGSVEDFATDN